LPFSPPPRGDLRCHTAGDTYATEKKRDIADHHYLSINTDSYKYIFTSRGTGIAFALSDLKKTITG
jgi:hypothetical protein